MEKMTPEFKALQKKINKAVADANLPEQQQYALLAGCIAQVLNTHHPRDFEAMRVRMAIVCERISIDNMEKKGITGSTLKLIAIAEMKGIDREEAQRLGVADMVQSVLSLLQKVDNITIDIQITIKQKSI